MRYRFLLLLASVLLGAAACSSAELQAALPTEAEIVESLTDSGLTDTVSTCVVGLGKSEFEIEELDPAAVNPAVKSAVKEFVAACQHAEDMINAVPVAPPQERTDLPFEYGDDALLDGLWDQCEAGQGYACDELWKVAPLDSVYEAFGISCGERHGVLDCSAVLVAE